LWFSKIKKLPYWKASHWFLQTSWLMPRLHNSANVVILFTFIKLDV